MSRVSRHAEGDAVVVGRSVGAVVEEGVAMLRIKYNNMFPPKEK